MILSGSQQVWTQPKNYQDTCLKKVGDLTWHYHAGIRTFPFQIAVKYNIPDVFLGEHGFAELTGMVSMDDFVEHTRWSRKEHDMRGFEPEELVGKWYHFK